MLTTLKTGLKCLLQGALVALATVAYAGDEAPQVSDEVVKTSAQHRADSNKGSLLDSAVSILNFKAKPTTGAALSPEPKLMDRLEMAGKQLAADAAYAAQTRTNAALGLKPGEEISSNVILGSDNRQRVTNTQQTPYKAICYLEITFPRGTVTGTGEFVHPRILLSAAHCVYDSSLGGWAKYIRVVPGKNGSSEPYGSQYCARLAVPPEWTSGQQGNRDFDMSWIIMPDRTLYNRTGYHFGYQTTADATLRTTVINLSGYHGDKSGQQWFMGGGGNQVVYASQFRHTLDTTPGASGSPVWIYTSSNGQRRIAGVHVAGVPNSYNVACRMTSRYFNWTQSYNSQYP